MVTVIRPSRARCVILPCPPEITTSSFLPLLHHCGSIRAPMSDPISRLQFGRDEIDRAFSQGYAAANPDVVASVTTD